MVLGGKRKERDTGAPDTDAKKLADARAEASALKYRARSLQTILDAAQNATRRAKAAEGQSQKDMEHLRKVTRETQARCVASEAEAAAEVGRLQREVQRHQWGACEQATAYNLLEDAHRAIVANLKASDAEQKDLIADLRRQGAEDADMIRSMLASKADEDWWTKFTDGRSDRA